ncbi:hypothetical protein Purlil1_12943 [Purpureocillium lilacinum]|uniref:Nephrocystin 3-like N-terminal domain-containing protein n=1 Tax=Purpureocillium lilacinum TaxID=33203 RepID=A0ABR0BFN3_PURLI|nr:hypothetical protein Purlil1_12943 [Purpureocillium lilacinum]
MPSSLTVRLHTPQGRPALDVVYASTEAQVDIIAVHGLGADVDWSWTWKDPENPDRHVKWLQDSDMLPKVVPYSRILLYNYDSRWHANAPKIRLSLCGEDLIRSVRDFREEKTASRPIVFLGHSLGGNVIQQALLYANSDDEFKHVATSTAGVIFLGTPLRGSKFQSLSQIVAWFLRPAGSHDGVIRDLGYGDANLMDKLHQFCRMRNSLTIPTSCFFELCESDYCKRWHIGGVIKGMVVDESSACLDSSRIPLYANHFMMNKYSGPRDRSFQSVSAELRRMCEQAPALVQRRARPKPVITDRAYALAERPEAKDCLRDLFLTDPYEDMKALRRREGGRAKDTCDWILGTDELTAWLGDAAVSTSPPTDVLWLLGNPGTGKSTMSMYLAEALSEVFSKTADKTLAYFFCASDYDTRKTATAIVRGLILQMVQQHPRLIEHVLPKYEERGVGVFNSFDAVWAMFLKACADKATGRKYCVVDALDECEPDEQKMLLKQIKETFGRDRSGDGGLNFRVLVTSRPYPEIDGYLRRFPHKDLASFKESSQDIDKFIDEKVTELGERNNYPKAVAANVTQLLRDKAGGTFLWVGLACQELETVPSKNVVARLEKIPAGLRSRYTQLLDTALRQDDEDPDTIKRLLGFVMLYQEEDEEERIRFTTEIIAACRLMIVLQDDKVLLLHQSVRDFLVDDAGSSKGFISELETHSRLASRCVDCLIERFSLHGTDVRRHDEFVSYSTQFWPVHAHMAKERFRIEDRQAEFFTIDSRTLKAWWGDFRGEQRWEPAAVSIFHVAARWGIPLLVDYALSLRHRCAGGSTDTARYLLYVDPAHPDWRTPLAQCAASGHAHVFKIMLERAGPQSLVDQAVAHEAAQNEECGAELMDVLLDRRGDQVTITEDTVTAAAGNWRNGAEVMKVLLDRKGDQVTITEAIVMAAAGNRQNGAEVIKVLLDRKGAQVTITEAFVMAAARNEENGSEVMKVLLDRKGDQVTITEGIVKAAAGNLGNGTEVMKVLLDRKGDQVTITEGAIAVVAGNFRAEMMELLLDLKGDQVAITEDIVKAAARNEENGHEMMKVILDRKGDQVKITEDIVMAAAGNLKNGSEVMKVLLDRKGDQVTISEDIVMAAARNVWDGAEVMKVMLDRKGDQVTITDAIVMAAARNVWNGAEVMKVLLVRKGDQVTITEDIVVAAARNKMRGHEMMEIILDLKGDQVTIKEAIVMAAARNEENGSEVMKVLLDRKGDQVTITEDIVKAAAANRQNGAEVMKVILDRKVDQEVA